MNELFLLCWFWYTVLWVVSFFGLAWWLLKDEGHALANLETFYDLVLWSLAISISPAIFIVIVGYEIKEKLTEAYRRIKK